MTTPEQAKRIVDIVEGAAPEGKPEIPQPFDSDGDDFPPPSASDGDGPPRGPPGDPATLEFCARLDQNDTDNGRRLLTHFGGDCLFVREIGWHNWAGTHWEAEGGQQAVERLAQETARRIKQEADYFAFTDDERALIEKGEKIRETDAKNWSKEQKALVEHADAVVDKFAGKRASRWRFAISSGNRARTVAMIAQAAPHRTVRPADLDTGHMLFNLANGTLKFRRFLEEDLDCPDPDVVRMKRCAAVELIAHDRAHLIAKIAPWTFDPGARCPRFDAFLGRFQPDPESRRFLQIAAGRGMLGGASTQALIFLYGDGSNGKSVFMEVLARMLGAYTGRLKPDSITGTMEQGGDKPTPDFARLQGKRFVAIAELQRGAPLRESLVKTMTGSEPMPVRHLNQGFFDLLPEFIPFMSGNQLPEIGGLDHGIWRRMKFVEWPVKIPDEEQRPFADVVEELMEEASGILNWLITGAMLFLAEGLVDPPKVRELGVEHRSDLDPVGNFVRDCVRRTPGQRVQARTIYAAFISYCRANALREWKEKSFSIALKQKGFAREDKRIRYWLDCEIYDVPGRPDDDIPPPDDHWNE